MSNLCLAAYHYLEVKRNDNFFAVRKPKEQESAGRSSGSLDWRISRGEIQDRNETKHIWIINKEGTSGDKVTLKYSVSLDQYEFITAKNKVVKNGWKSGVFEQEDIFRKEEKDWKMTYLARKGNLTSRRNQYTK